MLIPVVFESNHKRPALYFRLEELLQFLPNGSFQITMVQWLLRFHDQKMGFFNHNSCWNGVCVELYQAEAPQGWNHLVGGTGHLLDITSPVSSNTSVSSYSLSLATLLCLSSAWFPFFHLAASLSTLHLYPCESLSVSLHFLVLLYPTHILLPSCHLSTSLLITS